MMSGFIIFLIGMALVFDFINGFHDAANSIATAVSTRILKPSQAVIWAAFFNFVAFLFFETKVANTIGKGLIDPSIVDAELIFSVLLGAIIWNLVTWFYGIPSSSSHALVGGLVGAGIAKAGFGIVHTEGLVTILISIVASPLLGFFLGYLLMKITRRLCASKAPLQVDRWFRKLQLVSAAMYSLGHGGNDAQKTMGIIAVLLFSSGYLGTEFHVPFWVVLVCQLAMALGTLFGGWRIVKTMGDKITKLKPIGGFCAETAGAFTLFLATAFGIPVSTTHTITGSIVGVGTARALQAVRWNQTQRIVTAWVVTMPVVALLSSVTFIIVKTLSK
ncbi:MAG: inorganic phosphate transporter [Myxococcaceae bacterium]